MIVEISVAVIALAIVVLVVFAARTLQSMKASLDQINDTLAGVEQQLHSVGKEVVTLIHTTNGIAEDVQDKMKTLDSFFHSAAQVGEAVDQATLSVKQVSAAVSQSITQRVQAAVHNPKSRISDLVELTTLGIRIWNKLKKGDDKYVR